MGGEYQLVFVDSTPPPLTLLQIAILQIWSVFQQQWKVRVTIWQVGKYSLRPDQNISNINMFVD
jgi:hypothetical protein